MKLDRNVNANGMGKYGLLNLRNNTIQWGAVGSEDEFFVIKLKDKFAKPALEAYADAAREHDPEYANEIDEMVTRAGVNNPYCKLPD